MAFVPLTLAATDRNVGTLSKFDQLLGGGPELIERSEERVIPEALRNPLRGDHWSMAAGAIFGHVADLPLEQRQGNRRFALGFRFLEFPDVFFHLLDELLQEGINLGAPLAPG